MSPLPNPGMDFTAFDTLPAASLDDLVENIEALSEGTGFDNTASGWNYVNHSASQAFTNITKGSGTVASFYRQVGKQVHFFGKFTYGSGSAVGTDARITLPFTVSSNTPGHMPLGNVILHDSSSGAFFDAKGYRYPSESAVWPLFTSVATAPSNPFLSTLAAGSPFTWDTGDFISWNVIYERS